MSSGKDTVTRVVVGFGTVAATLFAGAALGLLYVKLFVPRKAMGWDGLADALGGLMVGALLGVVLGLVLIALVSVRAQLVGLATGAALALGVFSWQVATAPEPKASTPPVIEKAFQPFFLVNMRVGNSKELMAAASPAERPYPFTEAEVSTGMPELIRVGWGPGFERCLATPSRADLEALVPMIAESAAAAGPRCQTPESDLNVRFRWILADDRGSQSLDAGCLSDLPALRSLADAVGALAERLCESPAFPKTPPTSAPGV